MRVCWIPRRYDLSEVGSAKKRLVAYLIVDSGEICCSLRLEQEILQKADESTSERLELRLVDTLESPGILKN